jgi:hypothetical protein
MKKEIQTQKHRKHTKNNGPKKQTRRKHKTSNKKITISPLLGASASVLNMLDRPLRQQPSAVLGAGAILVLDLRCLARAAHTHAQRGLDQFVKQESAVDQQSETDDLEPLERL